MIDEVGWEPDPEVSEVSSLPELLAETPPGPQLAALLASVDRVGLGPDDLLRVAVARQRLVAHQEAQLLADLHAVARAVPDDAAGVDTLRGRYPVAQTEAAFALRWTHTRAAGQMVIADEVMDRLPRLFEALHAGRLDVPKVRVFTDLLAGVDDQLAVGLVDKLVDQAAGWTTGQLRARLRLLLRAAAPEVLAGKARERIGQRRVVAFSDDDSGLAGLAGYELAPHRVAAVMERLDAVAKAAKAAGDDRSMNQIRADVFIDLLSGEGIAAGGPITDGALGIDPDPALGGDLGGDADAGSVRVESVPWPEAPPDLSVLDLDSALDARGEPPLPADPEPQGRLWAFGLVPPPVDAADDLAEVEQVPGRRAWLAGFAQLPATRPATRCVLCGHVEGESAGVGPLPGPRRGTLDIVCSLTTLLGLADLPGELSGFAPVGADILRQVVAQMGDAQWRFSIFDPLRRLIHHGITNARPDGQGGGQHGGQQGARRRPDAATAAFIKARDRTCIAPGCRRAARQCDIDHSLDWVKGGATVHCNLCLLCKRHHLFKHVTGCELVQLSPGVFVWNTPAGLQYLTRSDEPMLDENVLAGLPKPANPDTALLLQVGG